MALTIQDVKKIYLPKNTRVGFNNQRDHETTLIQYNDAVNLYDAIKVVATGGGASATDLSVDNRTTTTLDILSSTGVDATVPSATTLLAGLMIAADKLKSDLISVTQNVDLDAVEASVEDLVTLTGVPNNSENLGVFTGSIIPDNQTIKEALQYLESAATSPSGNATNGISGTGTVGTPYKLGGNLTENTVLNGQFLRYFSINDATSIGFEADTNVATTTVKSSLLLTPLFLSGGILRSEINGNPNKYAEVLVTPENPLTSFRRVNGSDKAGVYFTSEQNAYMEVLNSIISRKYRVDADGHYLEGLEAGTTSKMLYVDNITGQVYKGDPPASGGGTSIHTYDAGNGAIVRASGTGVTFAKALGVGTFTAPLGVQIFSARINGVTADLAPDNSFSIVIPTTLTDDFPQVTKINRITGASPSTTTPYTYDLDNSPLIQVTASSASSVTVRVINLNTFSYWGLKLNF